MEKEIVSLFGGTHKLDYNYSSFVYLPVHVWEKIKGEFDEFYSITRAHFDESPSFREDYEEMYIIDEIINVDDHLKPYGEFDTKEHLFEYDETEANEGALFNHVASYCDKDKLKAFQVEIKRMLLKRMWDLNRVKY